MSEQTQESTFMKFLLQYRLWPQGVVLLSWLQLEMALTLHKSKNTDKQREESKRCPLII